MPEAVTYTARWIFPVHGRPLPRGTVTVRGEKIEAVEPHGTRTADVDLGNTAIIPGLVNPHTHLDLSGARGLIPPTDPEHFTDWLRGVIAYRRMRTAEQVQADVRDGLAECLRFGTTLIGDIAAEGMSRDLLATSRIQSVVFRELLGVTPERERKMIEAASTWIQATPDTDLCRKGISPHAPYSTSRSLIVSAAKLCQPTKCPMAIHLAESQGELELLYHRRGPFVSFLKDLEIWLPAALAESFKDVLRADFRQPKLFIHGNVLAPSVRIPRNSTIIFCPRTHAAFNHPPHPFREFLARGVRVCLGTDSLASNPDLDVLAEARFVRERYPDFPGNTLLKMITLSGAEALGWANEAGSLEPGKSADFVAIQLPNREEIDPHELLFTSDAPSTLRRTLFRGTWR